MPSDLCLAWAVCCVPSASAPSLRCRGQLGAALAARRGNAGAWLCCLLKTPGCSRRAGQGRAALCADAQPQRATKRVQQAARLPVSVASSRSQGLAFAGMDQDDDEYSLVRRWVPVIRAQTIRAQLNWAEERHWAAAVWRGTPGAAGGACAPGPASCCSPACACPARQAVHQQRLPQAARPAHRHQAPAAAGPRAALAAPPAEEAPKPEEASDDDFEVKLAEQQPLTQPAEVCLCSAHGALHASCQASHRQGHMPSATSHALPAIRDSSSRGAGGGGRL